MYIDPLLIIDVYLKEVRSVLELAVPAWHSGLTLKQSSDIERVQRVALYIILSDISTGRSPYDYDMSLVILDSEPLYVRRDKLCLTFAKKTVNSRHSDMFQKGIHVYDTRMAKPTYDEHNSNTQRCFKSPLNDLTRLLNEDRSKWYYLTPDVLLVMDNGCRIMPSVLLTTGAHRIVLCCFLP